MDERIRTPWYERAFWSFHARSYDAFGGVDSPEVQRVVDAIEHVTDDRSLEILDLGAGTGNYSIPLARDGHSVAALDVAPGMLTRLAAKAEACGVHIDTRRADLHEGIDAPAASYDVVLCVYLLQVMGSPADLVAEIHRVLRNRGHIVLVAAEPTSRSGDAPPARTRLLNRAVWRVKRSLAQRTARVRSLSRGELEDLLTGAGFEIVADVPDDRRIILVARTAP